MGILERIEDYIIRSTMPPTLKPVGEPPSDDGVWLLIMWATLLICASVTCGHCLAH